MNRASSSGSTRYATRREDEQAQVQHRDIARRVRRSGAKVGRPRALTPELHQRIVQFVKAGCAGEVAAQAAGISATTFYDILRVGQESQSGPERELLEVARSDGVDF